MNFRSLPRLIGVALPLFASILSGKAMAQTQLLPPNYLDVTASGNGGASLYWPQITYDNVQYSVYQVCYGLSGASKTCVQSGNTGGSSNSLGLSGLSSGTYDVTIAPSGGTLTGQDVYIAASVDLASSISASAPTLSFNPSNSTLNWSGGSGGSNVYFYVGTSPGAESLSFQATAAQVTAQSLPYSPFTRSPALYIQAAYTNNATFDQRSGEVVYEPPTDQSVPLLPGWATLALAAVLSAMALSRQFAPSRQRKTNA